MSRRKRSEHMGIWKKIRGKRFPAGCMLLVCLLTLVFPQAAYAAQNDVTLAVEQEFTKPAGDAAADTFTYTLTALQSGSPMPAGSIGDTCDFTMTGTDKVNIGPITYGAAGTYNYELRQTVASAQTGYTYDMQVYAVEVYVTNTSGGLQADVVVYNEDGLKVSTIAFENTYNPLELSKFVAAVGTLDYQEVTGNLPVEVDEQFNWYIRSSLPAEIGTAANESFVITDAMAGHFDYTPDSVNFYVISDRTAHLGKSIRLDGGVDYVSSFNQGIRTLTVELSAAGLQKVKDLVAKGYTHCVVSYSCKVNDTAPQGVALYSGATLEYARDIISRVSLPEPRVTFLGTGSRSRSGSRSGITAERLNANSGTRTVATVELAVEPEVHTGKIGITKLADGTKKALAGAEFGIAATKADAQAGKFIATGTTDQRGELVFSGLKYGLPGDGPEENSNNTTFWLVETKAPDGYKLLDGPVEIRFSYQKDPDSGKYYFARVTVYDVLSGKGGSTSVVKTGDNAGIELYQIMFVIGGIVIIVCAVCLIRTRKKRSINTNP